ncbi:MAG: GNAT family N-acetyltransferase [Synergistaceae bacterium]|nr:GNAT family N-acetyltransferase [Synergistaceae bacterium]
MDEAVISNLRSLIEISGSLPMSRKLVDPRGLWACDVGVGSAYENYALLSPESQDASETEGLIASGLEFFSVGGIPHIWPIFPGLPEQAKALLERGGARLDGVFSAMTADIPQEVFAPDDGTVAGAWISDSSDSEKASDWADAAWQGFDSGEPAPDGFRQFVSDISLCGKISLLGLIDKGKGIMASTGLLCQAGGVAGIYYVSTRHEFRKRGLGLLVMKLLMERGFESGCRRVCLIATPDGRPLYLKCGFKEAFPVPIMMHEGGATERGAIIR